VLVDDPHTATAKVVDHQPHVSHDTAFNIVTDAKKIRVYDGAATLSAGNLRRRGGKKTPCD
jgi:hypothetical protein